jgi:chemotaxis protein CheC
MKVDAYTEDQRDALQEITNVAMGQAGSSLATVLGAFVVLSVPRVRIVGVEHVSQALREMVEEHDQITATRQAFYNLLRGEALVIFDRRGCHDLADLMGHDVEDEDFSEDELLLDVSNILVGAVLTGLGRQIETDFGFSAPSVIGKRIKLDDLLSNETLNWAQALLIEVNFSLEERHFKCHLIMLLPEESVDLMRQALDQILEGL